MEANWKPLENRLGAVRCAGFMFMGRVNGINLYKHGISRSYLYLDDDGNCFVAAKAGCYLAADFDQELSKLEERLKGLRATWRRPTTRVSSHKSGRPCANMGFPCSRFRSNQTK